MRTKHTTRHPTAAMCPLRVLLLCPLRVLLLWALLSPGTGIGVWEKIFTRPGSDLLLPIRLHLTLNPTDRWRCDQIEWIFIDPTRDYDTTIFIHRRCTLDKYENALFPNMKISENGSLIISNVTPENDGLYRVYIENSAGGHIQRDDYIVHVEVPVSVPLLHVSCLRNGSAEISCRVEAGTKPNICLSVIGGSQERYSASTNKITAIVGSPGPWNITCTVENGVSRSEESRAGVTCPVPVSVPLLHVSCLRNDSAEISCRVEAGTKPNIRLSVIGGSQERYSASANNITAIVGSPGPWDITCTVENGVSRSEESRAGVTCPDPVSDPVLDVTCLQNGSAEISCWVENGTDPSIYLTVSGELEVYNVTSSEWTVRVTVPPVLPPDSWNIRCSAKNDISERSTNQTHDACPGESRSAMWSGWSHFLSPGVVFVLYTVLYIFMVNDLRKMKNKKNRSERRTRRGDQVEMEK